MSPFLPPNLPATRPGQLLKFSERILKRVKLSTEGVAEARAYCEVACLVPLFLKLVIDSFPPHIQITNRDERNVFEFIHLLELKDLLKNSIETQVTQWKPTAALLVRGRIDRYASSLHSIHHARKSFGSISGRFFFFLPPSITLAPSR
jgi:hypothetical protein